MKHFLKGAAAIVIVMIISIVINVICNKNGIELNSTSMSVALSFVGISIYHILIKNEKE